MVKIIVIVTVILCFPLSIQAKRLNPIGHTFAIAEPDLLVVITERLQHLDKIGFITAQQQQLKQQAKQAARRPKPYHLPTTSTPATNYFDPSITVTEDITDSYGTLIITAGTRINPLDHSVLKQPLLFLNTDDLLQRCWLNQQLAQYPNAIIILAQGDVVNTASQFNRHIYFDQSGILLKKLAITTLPAIITQAEKQLKIQRQVPCPD